MGYTFWRTLSKKTTLEETLEATAKIGLKAYEFQDQFGFGLQFPSTPSRARLERLVAAAESYGIRVPAISAMAGSLLSSDSDAQISYYEKWLRLASSIDCRILKINLGHKPPNMKLGDSFQRVHRSLVRLTRTAEDHNVTLAPELYPHSYPSGDPIAMITLMKIIGSKKLRHTMDNHHLPRTWALSACKLLAPYTVHAHASVLERNSMVGENSALFRFREFLRILKAAGYRGHIMIEWKGRNETLQDCERGIGLSRDLLLGAI